MTTLTPPPPAFVPPPAPPEPAPGGPHGASRVIAILAIVLGVVVALGTVAGAVVSTVSSALVRTESRTLAGPFAGVDTLDVDLSAGTLTIVFVDSEDAQLEVTSGAGAQGWTIERDGDALEVSSPEHRFGPGWLWGGNGRAELRLPSSLASDGRLHGSLRVSAGELTVAGTFDALELELGAGQADVSGTVRDLSAEVNAGRVAIDVNDVETADLSASAGAMTARLRGTAPRSTDVDVSAGSIELTVPRADYDVRSTVTAGRFDNRLGPGSGSDGSITVQVSAGRVALDDAR